MKTFDKGDRVTHPTHGEGTVIDSYDGTGWPTVQFDGGPKLMTHSSFLTAVPKAEPKFTPAVPEPMFTLAVTDTEGWRATAGPYPKDQIDALMASGFDWSTAQTVTINRVTKNA